MTAFRARISAPVLLLLTLAFSGCCSPYHADRGALFGGLLGAGTGAVVGHALGSTAAGAAVGAGVGALSGAAIGSGMDESEARNRALIEQRLGRQVLPGAVTVQDAVAMTQSGVAEELIVNHVRAHGVAAPLQTGDLIYLQQQRVSPRVIEAMQMQPVQAVQAVQPVAVYPPPPGTVIIEDRWGPPYYYHHRHYPPPGVSWGVSVGH